MKDNVTLQVYTDETKYIILAVVTPEGKVLWTATTGWQWDDDPEAAFVHEVHDIRELLIALGYNVKTTNILPEKKEKPLKKKNNKKENFDGFYRRYTNEHIAPTVAEEPVYTTGGINLTPAYPYPDPIPEVPHSWTHSANPCEEIINPLPTGRRRRQPIVAIPDDDFDL